MILNSLMVSTRFDFTKQRKKKHLHVADVKTIGKKPVKETTCFLEQYLISQYKYCYR